MHHSVHFMYPFHDSYYLGHQARLDQVVCVGNLDRHSFHHHWCEFRHPGTRRYSNHQRVDGGTVVSSVLRGCVAGWGDCRIEVECVLYVLFCFLICFLVVHRRCHRHQYESGSKHHRGNRQRMLWLHCGRQSDLLSSRGNDRRGFLVGGADQSIFAQGENVPGFVPGFILHGLSRVVRLTKVDT